MHSDANTGPATIVIPASGQPVGLLALRRQFRGFVSLTAKEVVGVRADGNQFVLTRIAAAAVPN